MKRLLKEIADLQPGVYVPSSDCGGRDAMNVVGLRDFDEDLRFLETSSKVKPELVKDKYIVEESDVLFSTRMKFNAFRLPLNTSQVYVASNSFVIIKPDVSAVLPEYLTWFLNHPETQSEFSNLAQATSRVPYINLKKLEEIAIELPELAIQREIVHINMLRRKEKQLMQALVQKKEQYIQSILLKKSKQ